MIRVVILCIFIQLASTKTLDRNYERAFEKGVLKKDNWKPHSKRHNALQRQSQESSNESEETWLSNKNDDIDAIDLSDTRRTNILRYIKHLLFSIPDARFNKRFEDMTRIKKDDVNITTVLIKLTEVLEGLNRNLKMNNENSYLTLRVPVEQRRMSTKSRLKRDVGDKIPEDTSVINLEKDNNVTKNNSISREREETNIVTDENTTIETSTVNNDEEDEEALLRELPIFLNNDAETTESDISGRRSLITQQSRVKEKLLEYLEDMFNDIDTKIHPLTRVKLAISADNSYRIGYIIANIDTLEINLKKLRNDMKINRVYWNDAKIMELFDKLKVTNNVVSTLLDTLRSYLPRPYVL